MIIFFTLRIKIFKVNIIHVLLFYAVITFLSTSQQTVIAECWITRKNIFKYIDVSIATVDCSSGKSFGHESS